MRETKHAALLAAFLLPGMLAGQPPSARTLIRFLKNEIARPHGDNIRMGLFTCGQQNADIQAAAELVRLGRSALPELEREMDALIRSAQAGHSCHGVNWIALAYARLAGPAGAERIVGLQRARPSSFIADSALAVAHGLTSFVSDSRLPMREIRCWRDPAPSDALDRLITGWMKGDREWLESSAVPSGRQALAALRGDASIPPDGPRAVGYSFAAPAGWADAGVLSGLAQPPADSLPGAGSSLSIETKFTTGTGEPCGSRTVAFTAVMEGGQSGFLLSEQDFEGLSRLLRTCSSR